MGYSWNTKSSLKFVKGWWEELGEYGLFESNEKNKLKESEYGKTIKLIIKTANFPNGTMVKVQIEILNSQSNKTKICKTIEEWTIMENIAIIPVYLEPEWFEYDGWYGAQLKRKDQFYFHVSANVKERKNALGYRIEATLAKDDDNILMVRLQPSLILIAYAVVEKFYPGSDIWPIPNTSGWKKNRGYWYRLGRAYKGLGTMGTQTISYIYAKKGKIVKYGEIVVKGVRWHGDQTQPKDDFEHPAPNSTDAIDVIYDKGGSRHFKFHVEKHPENLVYIHGGKDSEGCFVLGGDEANPRTNTRNTKENEAALFIWNLMDKLLNENHKEYENGAVKIANVVREDKVTKLDYNYKDLHKTGLDTEEFRKNPNAELIEDKEKITPLSDDEVIQFLKERGKKKNKHSEYFRFF